VVHLHPNSRRERPLCTTALFLLALAASPTDSRAQTPATGEYELVARHSGKCLDVPNDSMADAAALIQWDCHGGDNQAWKLETVEAGYYRLVSRHSGKALDVSGASVADAAAVLQFTPHSGQNQQWRLEAVSDGYYRLVARHSGKALDVNDASTDNGATMSQFTPHQGANQQWLLRPAITQPPSSALTADTVRFLEQATFGPTSELVAHVREVGIQGYLDEQFQAPSSGYPSLPLYPSTRDNAACPANSECQRDNYTLFPLQNRFFVNALYGPDQLRQRVAFALHQILVVSGVEVTLPGWVAPYLQLLDRSAFGNFRQLLFDLTLNPAMGNYLDIANNTKTRPNENYAREILQLFSIGTVRLNPDGSQQLDGSGQPVPTYTQTTIDNFARVFTGWQRATAPATGVPNYRDPMTANEAQHDTDEKVLLNDAAIPKGQNATKDLNDALDNIFNHPNVGPFIGKQLIQHLVTSNPSPAYVARVAAAFDGGQTGVRGDMKAVIRAILLDPEARGAVKTEPNYGRLRHPAQFVVGLLRAFGARSANGTTASNGYLNPQTSAMGMDVFRPPSVFSYFSPTAVAPFTTGVRGPEFGLFSTSTALRRLNFVNTMVFSSIAPSTNDPTGTSLDLTAMQSLAANPIELVEALNTLLMHGSMSTAMRDSVLTAVAAVPASNLLKRARTAVYLVATSSQYQVER
jgi:uncharacterized protein (DUF1800 family)